MSYNRRRAYILFHDSCEVLEGLSTAFPSARAMARLAMETMQEVERVATERTRRDSLKIVEQQRPLTERHSDIEVSRNLGQLQSEDTCGRPGALETPVPDANPGISFEHFDLDFLNGFEGDAGVFGDFDPNFNLGRIDAIFSANLDLSTSYLTEE